MTPEREAEYLQRPDPERIWLSPKCDGLTRDGRQWCDHALEDCPECDCKAVEYVRADLARTIDEK